MDLRLYSPSIAASKERIVSRGRSQRLRVGFERSGSTANVSDWVRWETCTRTDSIAVGIGMGEGAERLESGLFERSGDWTSLATGT